MKITKIYLNNYKQYQNFEWNINENVNVNLIYGQNASGKSTLLSIRRFFTRLFYSSINPELNSFSTIFNEFSTMENDDDIEVNLQFRKSKKYYEYQLKLGKNDQVTFERLSLLTDRKEFKEEVFSKEYRKKINIDYLKDTYKNEIINLDENTHGSIIASAMILLNKYRDVQDEMTILVPSIFMKLVDKRNREDVYKETYTSYFFEELSLRNQMLIDVDNLNLLKDDMESFIEQFSVFVREIDKTVIDVKLQTIPQNNQSFLVTLLFVKRINKKIFEIPLNIESNGTKTYLEMFREYSQIIDPSQVNAVFIDEFGSYLNETLIVKFYEKIHRDATKFEKQIFIATHSAILLSKEFINIPVDKDWNKGKWVIDKGHLGVPKIKNLAGLNKKYNTYSAFINGLLGGAFKGEMF